MSTAAEHLKLPLRSTANRVLSTDGVLVAQTCSIFDLEMADDEEEELARLIVRSVNAHSRLFELVKDLSAFTCAPRPKNCGECLACSARALLAELEGA